jgi:hypothetical protein
MSPPWQPRAATILIAAARQECKRVLPSVKGRLWGSHHAQDAAFVIVLMGVAGCGKSTTALRWQKRWLPFRDADSLHPPANIAKMIRSAARR